MSEVEGIKDFVECNKQKLNNLKRTGIRYILRLNIWKKVTKI